MTPSSTTIVSQPSTASGAPSRRTARALRRAFSTATRPGSLPCSSSFASETLTVNGTPRRSSRARRWGEPDASTSESGAGTAATVRRGGLQVLEEQGRLTRGRLRRVGPVHHVGAHLDREVAADAAGRGLQRIGRADQLARRPDRVAPLQHHRDERARRDEVDELAEERPLGVLGVVALRELARDGHVAQREDAQALALEAGDDLAGQAACEGVGLYEDQRSVHGFLWSVLTVGAGAAGALLRCSDAHDRRGGWRAR